MLQVNCGRRFMNLIFHINFRKLKWNADNADGEDWRGFIDIFLMNLNKDLC